MIARAIAWSARNLLLVLFGTAFAAAARLSGAKHRSPEFDQFPDSRQRNKQNQKWQLNRPAGFAGSKVPKGHNNLADPLIINPSRNKP